MQSCATAIDVAIVGAGISGIACASALVGSHHTFAVLDARSKVGGRLPHIKAWTWARHGPGLHTKHGPPHWRQSSASICCLNASTATHFPFIRAA